MNIVSRCRESNLWVYGYLKECGGAGECMGSVRDVLSRLLRWRLILCLAVQTVGKLLNVPLCPLQDI